MTGIASALTRAKTLLAKCLVASALALVLSSWVNPAAAQLSLEAAAPREHCDVPAYLLSTESRLPKVGAAMKAGRLDILVVGTASSSLPGPDGASKAYPARMEAALRSRLPGVAVNVAVKLTPKRAASDVVGEITTFAGDQKPVLTIWQTGTVDAIRTVDAYDFHDAMDEGVSALEHSGSEVMLVNPQYSPRLATVISVTSYLDTMRAVAQQHEVPLFDRFAIMRHWGDTDVFDLASVAKGIEMASRVHDCLGRALASFVIEAAGIPPGDLKPGDAKPSHPEPVR